MGPGLRHRGQSRALIDKAFTELGARRVHASTMAVNTGSRRVMEKAGHALRPHVRHADWPVRIEGDEEGDVEYAITRDEWEADRRIAPTAVARRPTLDDGSRAGLDERLAIGR